MHFFFVLLSEGFYTIHFAPICIYLIGQKQVIRPKQWKGDMTYSHQFSATNDDFQFEKPVRARLKTSITLQKNICMYIYCQYILNTTSALCFGVFSQFWGILETMTKSPEYSFKSTFPLLFQCILPSFFFCVTVYAYSCPL